MPFEVVPVLSRSFQSTPPVKAATHVSRCSASASPFQSTPPVKAATRSRKLRGAGLAISIHAAREGGDVVKPEIIVLWVISIHAAREGGDMQTIDLIYEEKISIHAAREGGDRGRSATLRTSQHFNPRRP